MTRPDPTIDLVEIESALDSAFHELCMVDLYLNNAHRRLSAIRTALNALHATKAPATEESTHG